MAEGRSQKSLEVEAGLYVLRYLGSVEPRTAPRARVTAASASADNITFVSAPGQPAGVLEACGGSLVIVATRRGQVDILVEALPGSSNLDARFTLDLLAPAAAPRRTETSANPVARLEPRRAGVEVRLRVKAHVARRGDLEVEGHEWIAGPLLPGVIEGVSFECDGADVGIEAQCVEGRDRSVWSAWLPAGSFVGTRQKASPLLGLRLRLSGQDRTAFTIDAEARFLGSPVVHRSGSDVEFMAPGGNDPLVGLRVRLVASAVATSAEQVRQPSRVRVFR